MGGCAKDVARVHTTRDGLIHALLWIDRDAALCRSVLLEFACCIPLSVAIPREADLGG